MKDTPSTAESRAGSFSTDDDLQITTALTGYVATVTFARRRALNALTPWDLPRLAAAIDSAGSRKNSRVVVVRGGNGAFSAGDDLGATADLDAAGWYRVVEDFHELTRVVRSLRVPVICAIDGVCVGGAFEFACSCDLRVATTRSRFGCPEVRVGVAPSNGSSVLLSVLCGLGMAAELFLTGRIIDAEEATRHGIVNRVVAVEALDTEVNALADEIAARAPLAVEASKALLVDAYASAVARAMSQETVAGMRVFETEDLREGLAAFHAKRPPRFHRR
jgi:enoyl-CoA hydratase